MIKKIYKNMGVILFLLTIIFVVSSCITTDTAITLTQTGELDELKYEISDVKDINKVYKENGVNQTLLIAAVRSKQFDIIEYLIEMNADVNFTLEKSGSVVNYFPKKEINRENSLYLAMNRSKNYEITKTVLQEAVILKDEKIVQYLLDNGADPNKGFPRPIIYSLFYGQNNITKMLIERGADVNDKNSYIGIKLKEDVSSIVDLLFTLFFTEVIDMTANSSRFRFRFAYFDTFFGVESILNNGLTINNEEIRQLTDFAKVKDHIYKNTTLDISANFALFIADSIREEAKNDNNLGIYLDIILQFYKDALRLSKSLNKKYRINKMDEKHDNFWPMVGYKQSNWDLMIKLSEEMIRYSEEQIRELERKK